MRKWLWILAVLILCACQPAQQPTPAMTVISVPALSQATATLAIIPSAIPPQATLSPTPAPTLSPTPSVIEYKVPVLPQTGLTLNGAPTGVGCTPVSIEMMTAYWNLQDSKYLRLSAQDIIDTNAAQGYYVAGRGMSSTNAADELEAAGYQHFMRLNSNKEELIGSLETYGPLGLLVKTNWVPDTMSHTVVLTAYDPVTDTVTINDPYYGSTVSWDWDSFDGIWGLNYAIGDPDGRVISRVYFAIYPQ